MSVGEIIAIVGSAIAAVASLCAIGAFLISRNKDKFNDGANDGSIKGDIKYMRNSFDDLRLDVKEVARKQDNQGERLTRVEESVKSAHHRIDGLEERSIGGKKNE